MNPLDITARCSQEVAFPLQQDQPQSLAWQRLCGCGGAQDDPRLENVVSRPVRVAARVVFGLQNSLRLQAAPVQIKGGLRDDSSGAHAFLFLTRKGRACNTVLWVGIECH